MNEPLGNAQQLLRAIKLLERLSPEHLDALARAARDITLASDEVLFREGEQGQAVFVVIEGAVQIFLEADQAKPLVLARLGPGELFGEHHLLDGGSGRRNAGARAIKPSRVLAIEAGAFAEVVAEDTRLSRDLEVRRNWVRRQNSARRGE